MLVQGAPVGEAMTTAIDRGWCTDIEEALTYLDEWVGDGMFASTATVPDHLLDGERS